MKRLPVLTRIQLCLLFPALALGTGCSSLGDTSYGEDTTTVAFEIHDGPMAFEPASSGLDPRDFVQVPGRAGATALAADARSWIVYWVKWGKMKGKDRMLAFRRARERGDGPSQTELDAWIIDLDKHAERQFQGAESTERVNKTQYTLVVQCGDAWCSRPFDALSTRTVTVAAPR